MKALYQRASKALVYEVQSFFCFLTMHRYIGQIDIHSIHTHHLFFLVGWAFHIYSVRLCIDIHSYVIWFNCYSSSTNYTRPSLEVGKRSVEFGSVTHLPPHPWKCTTSIKKWALCSSGSVFFFNPRLKNFLGQFEVSRAHFQIFSRGDCFFSGQKFKNFLGIFFFFSGRIFFSAGVKFLTG